MPEQFIEVIHGEHGIAEVAEPAPRAYGVYVCGPMTGLPNYNYDAFNAVELHLISKGLPNVLRPLEIVNPARNFGGDQTKPRRVYLSLALRQVAAADALVLLPDWYRSEGARLEVTTALDMRKNFFVAHQEEGGGWKVARSSYDAVDTVIRGLGDPHEGEPEQLPEQLEPIEIAAGELVRRGARRKTYGHPRGDFDRIAAIWGGILSITVTAEQVALCMAGLKLARLAETPQHRDSKVDAIGYIVCLDELDEEEAA